MLVSKCSIYIPHTKRGARVEYTPNKNHGYTYGMDQCDADINVFEVLLGSVLADSWSMQVHVGWKRILHRHHHRVALVTT